MLSSTQLRTIAERHGLPFGRMTQPEVPGTVCGVYFLGDSRVLRIATDANGVARFDKEARIIPLSREAGVHTAALPVNDFLDGSLYPKLTISRLTEFLL